MANQLYSRVLDLEEKFKGIKIITLNIDGNKLLRPLFDAYSSPLVEVYGQGKLLIREAGHFSFLEIEKRLERYYEILREDI